jgi:3',5'-cyclic AMP phosphodiesterase CpdA
MKRIAWMTDIHLNFLLAEQTRAFLLSTARLRPDAVLVSGDIGEAHNVCDYLALMCELLEAPVYFVLGNHDYYHGYIAEVRNRVAQFCADRPGLVYLTCQDAIELTPHVALVGHDGWADAREGNYDRSLVSMMDFRVIAELYGLTRQARRKVLEALGDEAAAHVRRVLPMAFQRCRAALLLTHVPPLRGACWHEGKISDDDWAPHFTCRALGDAILEIMAARPDNRLTVLCGHTHGQGECRPLPNVEILTGGAEYGNPAVQRVLELD